MSLFCDLSLQQEESHSGFVKELCIVIYGCATMVEGEEKNLVSKVTRRRLILHMILAAGMFPVLGFNSADRGVTD